ncbi:unnamed protein product [Colias eurytheme]|nr:unnamed protein product [Colias eurytheme]
MQTFVCHLSVGECKRFNPLHIIAVEAREGYAAAGNRGTNVFSEGRREAKPINVRNGDERSANNLTHLVGQRLARKVLASHVGL